MSLTRPSANALRTIIQKRMTPSLLIPSIPQSLPAIASTIANHSSCSRPHPNPSILQPPSRHLSSTSKRNHNIRTKSRPKTKLRVHAVSIPSGDYTFNDDDYDDGYDIDDDRFTFPNEQDEDDGWELVQAHHDRVSGTPTRRLSEAEQLDATAAEALADQRRLDERRARWIENAKPPVRTRVIDDHGRAYGKGGRKTSTARVWITPGEGVVTVNRRSLVDFFPREEHRAQILSPFVSCKTCGQFDVSVVVEGGGMSGKAGAIRHGVARALEKYNPEYRPPMKRLGFMTRDPRKVERKKVGLKKARKAPQWVRR